MTALVALGIAVLALALSCAGVWALLAWRQYRRTFDIFAERMAVDTRLEQLTTQALSAMREAARRAGGLS
ncbi:MAG: hypothetical protein ACP5O0_07770 [Acidimicrobiales bacterium]